LSAAPKTGDLRRRRIIFSVAGQVVKRTKPLERYRSLGLTVSELAESPEAAKADTKNALLELVVNNRKLSAP